MSTTEEDIRYYKGQTAHHSDRGIARLTEEDESSSSSTDDDDGDDNVLPINDVDHAQRPVVGRNNSNSRRRNSNNKVHVIRNNIPYKGFRGRCAAKQPPPGITGATGATGPAGTVQCIPITIEWENAACAVGPGPNETSLSMVQWMRSVYLFAQGRAALVPYTLDPPSMFVFDVSNASSPFVLNPTTNFVIFDSPINRIVVTASQTQAYALSSDGVLYRLDISNPSHIAISQSLNLNSSGICIGLDIVEKQSRAYVASTGATGLIVVDISGSTMSVLSNTPGLGGATSVVVRLPFAYVFETNTLMTSFRLAVYRVTSDSDDCGAQAIMTPTLVGSVTTPALLSYATLRPDGGALTTTTGAIVYAATYTGAPFLYCIDARVPTAPSVSTPDGVALGGSTLPQNVARLVFTNPNALFTNSLNGIVSSVAVQDDTPTQPILK